MTDEENAEMSTNLQNKLAEISQVSELAKSSVDTSFYDSSKDSFESVNNLLETATITEGIISINVDYKQLLNNDGAFGHLINNNPGVRILVNVIFQDNPSDINIMKAFSGNTNINTEFHEFSPYVIWNFGNYSGNITISEEMIGVIVAPNASVYQAAGNLNGQIISNVAGNNGELHQVTVTPNVPAVPEEPEIPTEEPEDPTEEPEIPTEEPEDPTETPEIPTEEPEDPGKPDIPEEPRTPDKPTVPEEPEIPSNPETPTKPEVPDTPNVPSMPEKKPVIPDTPTTVTTPQSPDTPTIVDTPVPKSSHPSENAEIPKTGDNTSIWIDVLGVLAGIAIIIVIILHIKKKKK